MAIVPYEGKPGTGLKTAAKAAKHPAKKHAAKKHAAKHAAKHPGKKAAKKAASHRDEVASAARRIEDEMGDRQAELEIAFHHLHRAAAIISLLEKDSGGDLRMLLEHGIDLYRSATGSKRTEGVVRCAFGILRATEHLGMAGLYTARSEHRVHVAPPPESEVAAHLKALGPRLDKLPKTERENARRLERMAHELLRRAQRSSHDPHLEYELTMAADGICTALEQGL